MLGPNLGSELLKTCSRIDPKSGLSLYTHYSRSMLAKECNHILNQTSLTSPVALDSSFSLRFSIFKQQSWGKNVLCFPFDDDCRRSPLQASSPPPLPSPFSWPSFSSVQCYLFRKLFTCT